MTLRMIDEASYQARTWTAARLKTAGVQVVAVKATEGTGYANTDYIWQVQQARQADAVVIHYHLALYGDSQAEAEWFRAHLYYRADNTLSGELMMRDNEAQNIEALQPIEAAAWGSAFDKEIKRLTGAPAVIQYTSRDPITRGCFTGIREPLFLADPGANPKAPPIIPGWPVSFLQYTTRRDGGTVTDVDCAYYGSVGQLRQLGIPQAPTPGGPQRYVSGGAGVTMVALAMAHKVEPSDVIAATVMARVGEHLAGKHQWMLGGTEAAYLDAGDWSRPLPAGSVWWVP